MNIVDSRRSCNDLWLSLQERWSNDDRYTFQTIIQLFDKVNIDMVNVFRKSGVPVMNVDQVNVEFVK